MTQLHDLRLRLLVQQESERIADSQPAELDLSVVQARCLCWLALLAEAHEDQPSPRSARVWIATDPDHTARAVDLARIALGSQGIRVGPADWPTPSPSERRKLLRDALRLTLWRATGSTVARLVPGALARKRADCGV